MGTAGYQSVIRHVANCDPSIRGDPTQTLRAAGKPVAETYRSCPKYISDT